VNKMAIQGLAKKPGENLTIESRKLESSSDDAAPLQVTRQFPQKRSKEIYLAKGVQLLQQ
jgi:hypothetical protein